MNANATTMGDAMNKAQTAQKTKEEHHDEVAGEKKTFTKDMKALWSKLIGLFGWMFGWIKVGFTKATSFNLGGAIKGVFKIAAMVVVIAVVVWGLKNWTNYLSGTSLISKVAGNNTMTLSSPGLMTVEKDGWFFGLHGNPVLSAVILDGAGEMTLNTKTNIFTAYYKTDDGKYMNFKSPVTTNSPVNFETGGSTVYEGAGVKVHFDQTKPLKSGDDYMFGSLAADIKISYIVEGVKPKQ